MKFVRNFHLFALSAVLAFSAATVTAEDGFEPLFSSFDNDGWSIQGLEKAGPKVEKEGDDEVLKVGGWDYWAVISKNEYENFILKFDIKYASRGNSGILIHTPAKKDVYKKDSRLEIQLESGDDPRLKAEESKSGAIERFKAPSSNPAKPIGEWNSVEIKYDSGKVWVTINGTVVQDGVDITTIDELKDHPSKGHIAIQRNDFKKEVYFKNLLIKSL